MFHFTPFLCWCHRPWGEIKNAVECALTQVLFASSVTSWSLYFNILFGCPLIYLALLYGEAGRVSCEPGFPPSPYSFLVFLWTALKV